MLKAMRLQALVCLFLVLQVTATAGFYPQRRDDTSASTPAASLHGSEPSPKPSPQPSPRPSATKERHDDSKQTDAPKQSTHTDAPDSTTTSATPTIQTTATVASDSPLNTSALFNCKNPILPLTISS